MLSKFFSDFKHLNISQERTKVVKSRKIFSLTDNLIVNASVEKV